MDSADPDFLLRRPTASPFDLSPFVFQTLRVGIVLLALVSHLYWLNGRPPHFDEGVNGWFTDQMQKTGFYSYDPNNYHGPLHFYVLFVFKCLFGRNLWALRLPTALIGVLTVDWIFRFGRFLDRRLCVVAALGMTLSSASLYYQRDAIHEAWLLFFLVLGAWGLFGLWQEGRRSHLWAIGLALAGMVLTKETYVIHLGCLVIAVPCLLLVEWLRPSRTTLLRPAPVPGVEKEPERPASLWTAEMEDSWWSPVGDTFAPQHWREADAWAVAAVALGLVVFFYSGNGYHWPGLEGLVTAYTPWGHKALDNGEGHDKPFFYWCKLLVRDEPLSCLGLLACLRYAVPALPSPASRPWQRWLGGALVLVALAGLAVLIPSGWEPFDADTDAARILAGAQGNFLWWLLPLAGLAAGTALLSLPAPGDWRVRLLAIMGPGVLAAYSIIHYKTPWCIISILWPFFFTAGALLAELADLALPAPASAEGRGRYGRWVAWPLAAVLLAVGGWMSGWLNFQRPTDVREDYVYVQTFDDLWDIVDPMLALARLDPSTHTLPGVIVCGSTYPLPWMLGDFNHIGYYADTATPPADTVAGADFLLVMGNRDAVIRPMLQDVYYRQQVRLRSALDPLWLYLRVSRFGAVMDSAREPEFQPPAAAAPEPSAAPAAPAESAAP